MVTHRTRRWKACGEEARWRLQVVTFGGVRAGAARVGPHPRFRSGFCSGWGLWAHLLHNLPHRRKLAGGAAFSPGFEALRDFFQVREDGSSGETFANFRHDGLDAQCQDIVRIDLMPGAGAPGSQNSLQSGGRVRMLVIRESGPSGSGQITPHSPPPIPSLAVRREDPNSWQGGISGPIRKWT